MDFEYIKILFLGILIFIFIGPLLFMPVVDKPINRIVVFYKRVFKVNDTIENVEDNLGYDDSLNFKNYIDELDKKYNNINDKKLKLSDKIKLDAFDKYRLFQKLNYHRFVNEIKTKKIIISSLIIVVVLLIAAFYLFEIKEHKISDIIVQDYEQIDKATNKALQDKIKLINDDTNLSNEGKANLIKSSITEYNKVDLAIAEGFFSKSLTKGIVIRALFFIFCFTVLGVLLRVYFNLLSEETKFRLMEEATTITLFHLFKKFSESDELVSKEEKRIMEQNIPMLIDRLYDATGMEQKNEQGLKELVEAVSHIKTAVKDMHDIAKDIKGFKDQNNSGKNKQ